MNIVCLSTFIFLFSVVQQSNNIDYWTTENLSIYILAFSILPQNINDMSSDTNLQDQGRLKVNTVYQRQDHLGRMTRVIINCRLCMATIYRPVNVHRKLNIQSSLILSTDSVLGQEVGVHYDIMVSRHSFQATDRFYYETKTQINQPHLLFYWPSSSEGQIDDRERLISYRIPIFRYCHNAYHLNNVNCIPVVTLCESIFL